MGLETSSSAALAAGFPSGLPEGPSQPRGRLPILFCLLVLQASPVQGQTVGVPGVNDFTINGSGSGLASPVDPGLSTAVTLVSFSVSAMPGRPLAGAMAASVALGAGPLSPQYAIDLDLVSLSIWIGPGSVIAFPIAPTIPPSGVWTLSVPVAFQGGETFALQFGLIDIGGNPITTQAHGGTVAGVCPSAFVWPGLSAANDLSPLSDDGGVNLALSQSLSFYGTAWTDLWVNMNGNVTFGAQDGDFTPSAAELLSDEPRIAPAWDDWVPDYVPQGTVRALDDGVNLLLEWTEVVHFPATTCAAMADSNTFGCRLEFATGVVEIRHGVMQRCGATAQPLVGISPGGGLSGPGNVDLGTGGVPNAGGPPGALDAIYEEFSLGVFGPFDLGALTFPLCTTSLLFAPTGGAGLGPYTIL